VTDIGLYVPQSVNPDSSLTSGWYWLVSQGTPGVGTINTLAHAFNPSPFSNDLYFTFGNGNQLPLVGHFDPPLASGLGGPTGTPPGDDGSRPTGDNPVVVDATPVVSPSVAPFVRVVHKRRRFRVEAMDRSTGQVRGILGSFRSPVQVSYRDVNLDGVLDIVLREKQGKRTRTRIFNGLDLTPILPPARQ
jgi:hypothetical protein